MRKFSDSEIDFMQADVESNFAYTAFIESTKRMFEAQGRDFYGEFIDWAKANGKMTSVTKIH